MATTVYANNLGAVTAADIGPSDTLLILSAGQGSAFPSLTPDQYMWATLIHPISHVLEVVKITARSGDTLTIERGRDGTTATAFPAGSVIEVRVVAELLREVNWRLSANQPNGPAVLEATGRLASSRLPENVVYSVSGKINADLIPDSFATDVEVAAAVAAGVAGKVNRVGDDMTGPLGQYLGGVNTQRVFRRIGASDQKVRYAEVIEANNAYVIYAYDPNGGAPTPALTLHQNVTSGLNMLQVGGLGAVWTTGTFDPNTRVAVDQGSVNSPKIFRAGFPANEGIAYFGNSGAYLWFNSSNFSFTNWCYGPNFVATSDERLKKSIRPHKVPRGFADNISLSSWEWRRSKNKLAAKGRFTGELAQHTQRYAPQHVSADGDGYLGIDKGGLALEGVVDLAARVRDLEAANAELQAMVRKLLKNR